MLTRYVSFNSTARATCFMHLIILELCYVTRVRTRRCALLISAWGIIASSSKPAQPSNGYQGSTDNHGSIPDEKFTSHRHLLPTFGINPTIQPKTLVHVNVTRSNVLHNCDGYIHGGQRNSYFISHWYT